jgi:hypothetical protein
LAGISSRQSIERAVIILFCGPLYTTLVHASDGFHNPMDRIKENKINGNFFIIVLFEFKIYIEIIVNNSMEFFSYSLFGDINLAKFV